MQCRLLRMQWNIRETIARVQRSFISYSSETMFNRTREFDCLMDALKATPQLNIITGPVDSGKTLLLENIMARVKADDIEKKSPIYPINLRRGTFHSVESFVNSLSTGMGSWVKDILNSIAVNASAEGINLSFRMGLGKDKPIDRLNGLLDRVSSMLPTSTILRGKQNPVLFVDEANRLRTLLRDADGQAALESFFEWLVMNTKEKGNFHVILASSDSFFNLWVEKFVGPSRYSACVLGHLDEKDSEKYWEDLVKRNHKLVLGMQLPEFHNVFRVCGGSIFLMNALLMELYMERNVGVVRKDLEKFVMVLQEQRKLLRALRPKKIFEEIDPPKWQGDELLEMMKVLISSGGIVEYEKMCNQFGEDVVNSVIEYNIMHVRPTAKMAFDVPWHNLPIITPESPAAKVAMKNVLTLMGKM